MDRVKSNTINLPRLWLGLMLALIAIPCVTNAQQSTRAPTPNKPADTKKTATAKADPDEMGNYTVTSSIEVGYRGLRVDGDLNKFQSDLNYKSGPRLFDTSFFMKSKDGKGLLFDTLMVTSTGWGGDPSGNMRLSVEKPEWYRFDATYRRFSYFRYLNSFANPNWIFSPTTFNVGPNPVTGLHGTNEATRLGDFDLTILPKNDRIRFNLGYSPERLAGTALTDYHIGGNEFNLLNNVKSHANEFRLGADGKLGPIDYSFLQGFRRFRDDSFINQGTTLGINLNPAVASFTTYRRNEPSRGQIDFTRFSAHTLLARKLDLTARIVYSNATSNFVLAENFAGRNFNTRITGLAASYNPPNVLNLGQYSITGNTKRPNTLVDLGATFMATEKLRISNTFRVETFQINGGDNYLASFFFTSNAGVTLAPIVINNGGVGYGVYKVTKYRKIQDTVEGDYQFSRNYSVHFGYRYGSRWLEQILSGFALNSIVPTVLTPEDDVEQNHTHAFFGGFRARPMKNWTLYFDAEHGTADNVFTRIGNYDYTNIRAKSRYAPTRKLSFNLALITKNNSNPSEIAGVSLTDFGVDIKSRTFTSAVDWLVTPRLSINAGYNYNWINSDAVIDYFFQVPPAASVRHPLGHTLYFVRNNFFFIDAVTRLSRRMTLYASYRVNKDNGQGNRVADPTGNPGILINSYPMSYQSPEGRLAIRINRHLDWNLGYQYYSYNESPIVSPRPENYHAHLPYTSLRFYFGRRE
jgi:hypothetical protein